MNEYACQLEDGEECYLYSWFNIGEKYKVRFTGEKIRPVPPNVNTNYVFEVLEGEHKGEKIYSMAESWVERINIKDN